MLFFANFKSEFIKTRRLKTKYKIWISFYTGFRESIDDYQEVNAGRKVELEDKEILIDPAFMLKIPQSLSKLSGFVLPHDLRNKNKVKWGKQTDKNFLEFLNRNKSQYEVIIRIFEGEAYFRNL